MKATDFDTQDDRSRYEQGARDVVKGADPDHIARVRNLDPELLRKYVDYAWDRVNSGEYKLNRPNLEEDLRKWFKEKWVRFGPDGKIRGDCARGSDKEGKPKCLPQSKAHALGKKGRASAASRKRRQDPNPERTGKAINVATRKKTNEASQINFKTALALAQDLHAAVQELRELMGAGQPIRALSQLRSEINSLNQQLQDLGYDYDPNSNRHLVPLTLDNQPQSKLKEQSDSTIAERRCPECGGPSFSELVLAEKQDACYHKVKSRYKVWPSAYASGALVQCRKKGAANWGNKSKNESIAEASQELWRVLEPRNIGGHAARYYVVKGQGKQLKMWRSKSGAGDFIKRADAEAKAAELNKGVAESSSQDRQKIYNQVYQIMVRQAPDFMYRANNADVKNAIVRAMSFGDQISAQDLATYAYGMLKSGAIREQGVAEGLDRRGFLKGLASFAANAAVPAPVVKLLSTPAGVASMPIAAGIALLKGIQNHLDQWDAEDDDDFHDAWEDLAGELGFERTGPLSDLLDLQRRDPERAAAELIKHIQSRAIDPADVKSSLSTRADNPSDWRYQNKIKSTGSQGAGTTGIARLAGLAKTVSNKASSLPAPGKVTPALSAPTKSEFDLSPDLKQKQKVPANRKDMTEGLDDDESVLYHFAEVLADELGYDADEVAENIVSEMTTPSGVEVYSFTDDDQTYYMGVLGRSKGTAIVSVSHAGGGQDNELEIYGPGENLKYVIKYGRTTPTLHTPDNKAIAQAQPGQDENDLVGLALDMLWGRMQQRFMEFAPAGSGGGTPPRGPRVPGGPGGGDDGTGEDPYGRPVPKHYARSIDFFGRFEADHFDKETFDKATGVFKGYWQEDDGSLIQIAYFKFDDAQQAKQDFDDSPGMGWYYEPEGLSENDPWGPAGRFAGDVNVDISSTVKKFQPRVGQTVKVRDGNIKGLGEITRLKGDTATVWIHSYAREFEVPMSAISAAEVRESRSAIGSAIATVLK